MQFYVKSALKRLVGEQKSCPGELKYNAGLPR